MKLSYKSVYHLLDQRFTRRTLKETIDNDVPRSIFESSTMSAILLEYFEYLEVMSNQVDNLNESFIYFMDGNGDHEEPIVLEKNKDLSILELAILSLKCEKLINPIEFVHVLEAQAESLKLETDSLIKEFYFCREMVTGALAAVQKQE